MSERSPRAGLDYRASYAEVRSWYPTDAACRDYLDWLRWAEGFWCPLCRGEQGWKLPDGRWSCGRCGRRVSATAGTIFHATRTPLTVWLAAGWLLVSQKHGISALGLKRTLGIGSVQTAWAMMHRLPAARLPAPIAARTYSRPTSRTASHAAALLPPFPMRPAFPTSEYYGGSATPRAHQQTARLAKPRSRPGVPGALPTFTVIRWTGSASGCTPAAHPPSTRSISPATTLGSPSPVRAAR